MDYKTHISILRNINSTIYKFKRDRLLNCDDNNGEKAQNYLINEKHLLEQLISALISFFDDNIKIKNKLMQYILVHNEIDQKYDRIIEFCNLIFYDINIPKHSIADSISFNEFISYSMINYMNSKGTY